ncbi:adenine methyltransferase [Candidatus Pacearchaeota archaeon]|nr:adenine methyltransferase [Candidatus Pacearchaeota archaeon]
MNSENNEWSTPQNIFDQLNKEFNFDIDICASHWNYKCQKHFTVHDDALTKNWIGTVWMNPPYGREIGKWAKKAFEESQKGSTVVCLIPARTETKWFHDYLIGGEVRFVKGRIHFSTADGKSGRPRFSSIVVILRPEPFTHACKQIIQDLPNKTN